MLLVPEKGYKYLFSYLEEFRFWYWMLQNIIYLTSPPAYPHVVEYNTNIAYNNNVTYNTNLYLLMIAYINGSSEQGAQNLAVGRLLILGLQDIK